MGLKGPVSVPAQNEAGKNLNYREGGNVTRGTREDHMDNLPTSQMTVISDAYSIICDFEWLERAYRNARKGKRYRSEIMRFADDLEGHLFLIQEAMLAGTYRIGPYRRLWVYIPKKRLVMALGFADRIVQWSIYQLLNPFCDRLMIEDSYACRVGKGSHKAAERLQYWLRQIDRKPGPGWYFLKLDISKYFYRVDHARLLGVLRKRITDDRLLAFLEGVINSDAEPFGLPPGCSPDEVALNDWIYDAGMPIGNLTSQLFANIYLNELDQFCKHQLHIHYYIRYMDDVIILAPDKQQLHRIKASIEAYLHEALALDLNDKTAIRPVSMGIEFVGIRTWATHCTLRKSTVRRLKSEARSISEKYLTGQMSAEDFHRRAASFNGLLSHTNSASLRWRLNEIYLRAAARNKEAQTDAPF